MAKEQEQLEGTRESDMALLKIESVNAETTAEFKIGDTVAVSTDGIICMVTDEIRKDGTPRRVYKVRPAGWQIH